QVAEGEGGGGTCPTRGAQGEEGHQHHAHLHPQGLSAEVLEHHRLDGEQQEAEGRDEQVPHQDQSPPSVATDSVATDSVATEDSGGVGGSRVRSMGEVITRTSSSRPSSTAGWTSASWKMPRLLVERLRTCPTRRPA